LTVFLVLSSAVDLVVSSSEGIDLRPSGRLFLIIYFGALYYAIFKYRFLDSAPRLWQTRSYRTYAILVVLIDTDRNVIVMNKECESALYMNANECLGRSFADLVHEADLVSRDLNALLGGEVPSVTRRLHFKQSSGIIIADSYLALVRDCFGDPVGVLMVGKENKGVSELRAQVRDHGAPAGDHGTRRTGGDEHGDCRTPRDRQRTVESHLDHMYNKLGIGNKIELLRIAV
jgi:hypothetical protein